MKRRQDDHPTIADPGPLDCCGWCYDWITTGHVLLSVTGYPQPEGRTFTELVIDSRTVLGIIPPPDSEVAATDVVVVVCSERCAEALEQALDADRRRTLGEVVPPREPSPEERLEAEELVSGICAWCYTTVGPDDPCIAIFATLNGSDSRKPGMIAIQIDGRSVPGNIPEPGSLAAAQGTHIAFNLCGKPCADALTAAIGRDLALRILH
jgi:hypothetical protein